MITLERLSVAEAVRREQKGRQMKQAGIALVFLSAILGSSTLLALHFAPKQQSPVTYQVATTTPMTPDAYGRISLIGKSAIVYDLTNGQTLYAQNMYAQLPLASVTKLLTLYAASQVLSPSSPVVMTPDSVAHTDDVADIGFSQGETFSFQDLARLTLAASSNNGATAIVDAAASSARAQDTTSLLASAATAIGLKQTYASNATGLDQDTQVSGAYGSAHDVAVLAGALLQKEPSIAQASTLPVVSITSKEGVRHTFANTDVDVTHIPNLLLSKTGYTDLAGGNLVVVYDAGIDHPIAVVVLGSTESGRFSDVQTLIAATAAHFGGTMPPVSASGTPAL